MSDLERLVPAATWALLLEILTEERDAAARKRGAL